MNKHVFEKIAKLEKTELSEVKVDLATLQSINKLDDIALKNKDKALAAVKKANDAKINAQNIVSATISSFEAVLNEGATLQKQAKDLGLSLPNDVNLALTSATRELAQFQDLRNKLLVKF
jgi:aconitase A